MLADRSAGRVNLIASSMSELNVSIIMAVRNEAAFIRRSLGAALAQGYPNEHLEIIVADGMSTDATRDILTEIAGDHHNLRIIENPGKIVAAGLNEALRVAGGDIIVRVDGHTVIDADYVRECVAALQATAADNVGGRMNAVGDTSFGRAVAAATSSRFGVGGARFHYSESEEWVDTVYLGAWRREVFQRVGTFDEEMVRNQDDEFNYRLRAHGGKILLNPTIRSEYYNRSTPWKLWQQYFQYGFWKVRVLQKHPRQMQPRQLIPGLGILALILLLLAAPIVSLSKFLILGSALIYLIANLSASVLAATRSRCSLTVLPSIPLAFAIIHIAYGCGFLVGLIRFWNCWEFVRRTNVVQPSHDMSS